MLSVFFLLNKKKLHKYFSADEDEREFKPIHGLDTITVDDGKPLVVQHVKNNPLKSKLNTWANHFVQVMCNSDSAF